jgi:hypothetical protein
MPDAHTHYVSPSERSEWRTPRQEKDMIEEALAVSRGRASDLTGAAKKLGIPAGGGLCHNSNSFTLRES